MTMRLTLPDAATRTAMLATGMEHGMEAGYQRLEHMIWAKGKGMAEKRRISKSSGTNSNPTKTASRPALVVDTLVAGSDHSLRDAIDAIDAIRSAILGDNPAISEGIKWNAPSYRTTESFATVNMRGRNGIGLILHFGAKKSANCETGAAVCDAEGLLIWLAKDRAIARSSHRCTAPL